MKYKEKGRVKEKERDGEKKGDRGWYADRKGGTERKRGVGGWVENIERWGGERERASKSE